MSNTLQIYSENKDCLYYQKKGKHHHFYPEGSAIRYTRQGMIVLRDPSGQETPVLHKEAGETIQGFEDRIISLLNEGYYIINGSISDRVMKVLESNISISK